MGNFMYRLRVSQFEIHKHNKLVKKKLLPEDRRIDYPTCYALKCMLKHDLKSFYEKGYLTALLFIIALISFCVILFF